MGKYMTIWDRADPALRKLLREFWYDCSISERLRKKYNIKKPPQEMIDLRRTELAMKKTLTKFKKWRDQNESGG